MLSLMAASLALHAVAGPAPRAPDNPPIQVKLSEDSYARGDRAKVKVRAARDGYLLVLRADGEGHVRVLYPLNPEDADQITGGKEFEVRGRGDREAFVVNEDSGGGTVLAAWSAEPFEFTDFTRNGHWDYRALTQEQVSGDPEGVLLDLADRMSPAGYQYDIAEYAVTTPASPHHYAGLWYNPWWDGYYGWWGYGPYWGPGWRVGVTRDFDRHRVYTGHRVFDRDRR